MVGSDFQPGMKLEGERCVPGGVSGYEGGYRSVVSEPSSPSVWQGATAFPKAYY